MGRNKLELAKAVILRALAFLRITEPEDNNISLTNMIVMAAIFVLLKSETADFSQVAALLTAVVAYTSKKVIAGKKKKDKAETTAKMEALDKEQTKEINKLKEAILVVDDKVSKIALNGLRR